MGDDEKPPSSEGVELPGKEEAKKSLANEEKKAAKKTLQENASPPSTINKGKINNWNIGTKITAGALFLTFVGICLSIFFKYGDWAQQDKMNKPFLQVTNVHIKQLEPNKKLIIGFSAESLGNFTVKVTKGTLGWTAAAPGMVQPYNKYQNLKLSTSFPVYLAKDKPKTMGLMSTEVMNEGQCHLIQSEIFELFLFGELYYRDEYASKDMVYEFAIKVGMNSASSYEINENKPVK